MNTTLTLKDSKAISKSFGEAWKIVLSTGLLALSAQIAIPLPFTPVPVTLQTAVIFLLAVILGPKKSSIALVAYICEGLLGLPVFSKGGSGLLWLVGPTGGYLVGFVLAAFTSGYLIEKRSEKSFINTFFSFVVGAIIILFTGSLWLMNFMSLSSAFFLGFLPFILSELTKILMVTSILPLFKK